MTLSKVGWCSRINFTVRMQQLKRLYHSYPNRFYFEIIEEWIRDHPNVSFGLARSFSTYPNTQQIWLRTSREFMPATITNLHVLSYKFSTMMKASEVGIIQALRVGMTTTKKLNSSKSLLKHWLWRCQHDPKVVGDTKALPVQSTLW